MTLRPFPAFMYRVEDPGDTRIAELEAALLESNDTAAAILAECGRLRGIARRLVSDYRGLGLDPVDAEQFLDEWAEAERVASTLAEAP